MLKWRKVMKKNKRNKKIVVRTIGLILLCVSLLLNFTSNVKADSTVVATVYLVSNGTNTSGASSAITGHSFLVVKNHTSSSLTIGHYNLGKYKYLSIGTWGNIADGDYAYYNIEKYRMINGICSYTPNVYLKVNVTKSQLEKLTKKINENYTWTLTKNCSRFARYCWNSMFSKDSRYHIEAADLVETPSLMYEKIKDNNYSHANFAFPSSATCGIKKVFVHTKDSKENLSKRAIKNVKLEN